MTYLHYQEPSVGELRTGRDQPFVLAGRRANREASTLVCRQCLVSAAISVLLPPVVHYGFNVSWIPLVAYTLGSLATAFSVAVTTTVCSDTHDVSNVFAHSDHDQRKSVRPSR